MPSSSLPSVGALVGRLVESVPSGSLGGASVVSWLVELDSFGVPASRSPEVGSRLPPSSLTGRAKSRCSEPHPATRLIAQKNRQQEVACACWRQTQHEPNTRSITATAPIFCCRSASRSPSRSPGAAWWSNRVKHLPRRVPMLPSAHGHAGAKESRPASMSLLAAVAGARWCSLGVWNGRFRAARPRDTAPASRGRTRRGT